ncbi:hypothetical protein [Taibaiella soli]|uniref:MORN repeat variant n=1 Tax=Taibaiella soli TaxID=1649169 RepID=A0A2W2BBH0_9BACT|nr:hypothetical protein [Taibaiella soli]PZF70986.1 hypothetical protein DN068_19970 [Taibaiella soli]
MKLVVLFFGCLFSIGYLGQKESKKINSKNMFGTPYVDSNFEKFDFNLYNSRIDKSSPVFERISEDGTLVRLMNIQAGLFYRATAHNSYFSVNKTYHSNGNIREKGLCFHVSCGTFRKGTWFEFNEQGKLIKEINYDKYYKFTFEQVLAFCEREGIRVDKGPILQSTGYHTIISRRVSIVFDDTSFWKIEWLKRPDCIETIVLNGNTGAITSREERKYINN